jgi:chaperonin cofactor prefoldin
MPDTKALLAKIQELRQQLNILIAEKDDLQDDEIIKVSKELDVILITYERMINRGKAGTSV